MHVEHDVRVTEPQFGRHGLDDLIRVAVVSPVSAEKKSIYCK